MAVAQLDSELVALLGTLQQAAIVVEDFRHESGPVLAARLNEVAEHLGRIDDANQNVPLEMAVPVELVATVERGENPDLFTLAQVDAMVAARADVTAKAGLLEDLRNSLVSEIPELQNTDMID